MALCIDCRRGFNCGGCSPTTVAEEITLEESEPQDEDNSTPEPELDEDDRPRRGNRGKREASLKDQQSTGRKRAAVLFPLHRSDPCEWSKASRTNPMGGGTYPVTFGCNNLQSHRHHGPDKSTLNNEVGNVSRICAFHHNNWHAKNDPVYIPGNPVMFQVQEAIKRGEAKVQWDGPIRAEILGESTED